MKLSFTFIDNKIMEGTNYGSIQKFLIHFLVDYSLYREWLGPERKRIIIWFHKANKTLYSQKTIDRSQSRSKLIKKLRQQKRGDKNVTQKNITASKKITQRNSKSWDDSKHHNTTNIKHTWTAIIVDMLRFWYPGLIYKMTFLGIA